jgi:hypothetical protein
MNPPPANHPQELVRQFNEDEAVWRCFRRKRLLRRLLSPLSMLPEEILDDLDWVEAEREVRPIRAIGKFFPAPSER